MTHSIPNLTYPNIFFTTISGSGITTHPVTQAKNCPKVFLESCLSFTRPLTPHHPPPPLQAERHTLSLHGGEGSLHSSGNATNWILPDICDRDAGELPSAAATPLFPHCCLSLPNIPGKGRSCCSLSWLWRRPLPLPETASDVPRGDGSPGASPKL